MFGTPYWVSGSGREAHLDGRESLPDDWEWLEDHQGCLGVVGMPSRMSLSGRWPSRMFGSGQKDPQMSGSGREILTEVWERSGGPPGCLGVVGRPSRLSRNGWKTIKDVWEWS